MFLENFVLHMLDVRSFVNFIFRNEWEPPDRKVDTRKFRSEPRSIFEYEPGKSSILEHERPVSKVYPFLYI